MNITDVRVKKFNGQNRLKAIALIRAIINQTQLATTTLSTDTLIAFTTIQPKSIIQNPH